MDEDVGVLQHCFHLLGIGDEVGRKIAAVELGTLHRLERGLETLRFLDGDDAVLADLLHRLGDEVADLLVVVRRDGAHLGDLLLAGGRDAQPLELLDHRLDRLLDAPLELHRVGAGGDVLETFPEDRLGQHRGGGGAVAGEIAGLGRDLLHQLGAQILDRIGKLDLLGHGHPVLGDGGRPEFPVEDDVAALGAESHSDRFGQVVDAPLELRPRVDAEVQFFRCHMPSLPLSSLDQTILARTSDALMMISSSSPT